jgi:hypothetical protein
MLRNIVYSVGDPSSLLSTYWANRTRLTRFAAGNNGTYLNNADTSETNTAGWRQTSSVSSTVNFTSSGTTGYLGASTTILVYIVAPVPMITSVSATGAGTLKSAGQFGYQVSGTNFSIRCNVYTASNVVTSISSVVVNWTRENSNTGGYVYVALIPGTWTVSSFNGDMNIGRRVTNAGDYIHTSSANTWAALGYSIKSDLYESVIPGPGFQLFMGNVVTPNGGTDPCLPYAHTGPGSYSAMTEVIDWAAYWYTHGSWQIVLNNSDSDVTVSRIIRTLAYSGGTQVADGDHEFPLWWVLYNGNANSASMSFRYLYR